MLLGLSNASFNEDIAKAANQDRIALHAMQAHYYDLFTMLEATVTFTELTQADLDSLKSSISSGRSGVNSQLNSLTSSVQSVETAKSSLANYEIAFNKAKSDLEVTKKQSEQNIVTAESNVKNREISLQQAQISYDEIVNPLRAIDLASYRTQLSSAANNLNKAKFTYSQATLISPIDGDVSALNYKAGDVIDRNDTTNPMAEILNTNTLYIEVKISEADINKIKVGDKAYATFDAVDGLKLEGEISFISLMSATDNNGIVTYLVRVVINNEGEQQIREGMTAFVNFVTAEAKDVLMAPVAAVKNVAGKPSVQKADGSWVSVVTGFTDGKTVEIISGLFEDDKITY